MTKELRKRMLKAVCLLLAFTGLSFLLAVLPFETIWPALLYDIAFWPIDGGQSFADGVAKLALGTTGAIMIILAYFMYMFVVHLYDTRPDLVRRAFATAILVWYAVEVPVSLLAGAPANIIVNLGFLALVLIPAAWPSAKA